MCYACRYYQLLYYAFKTLNCALKIKQILCSSSLYFDGSPLVNFHLLNRPFPSIIWALYSSYSYCRDYSQEHWFNWDYSFKYLWNQLNFLHFLEYLHYLLSFNLFGWFRVVDLYFESYSDVLCLVRMLLLHLLFLS